MTEVAWEPTTLPDALYLLRSRSASQGGIEAARRVHNQRGAIEELRGEAKPPIPWLKSRSAELAVFYALLGNWYGDRELLVDTYGVDYTGGAS